jgi:hypothetical protein
MIGEQTFEGRRENLSQANQLSRTYAVLLDALNRHRGKGQQKVTGGMRCGTLFYRRGIQTGLNFLDRIRFRNVIRVEVCDCGILPWLKIITAINLPFFGRDIHQPEIGPTDFSLTAH